MVKKISRIFCLCFSFLIMINLFGCQKSYISFSGNEPSFYQGETIDYRNFSIDYHKDDKTILKIYFNEDSIKIEDFDTSLIGARQAKVVYTNNGKKFVTQFNYIVKANEVESISGVTGLVTEYYMGDEIILNNAIITYVKSNGIVNTTQLTKSMITGFDTTTVGNKTMKITYSRKEYLLNYEVKAIEVESISGVTGIATEYYENDEIKLTDAKVNYINNNGTTGSDDVTLDMITSFDTTTIGNKTMKITYSGKEYMLNYEVKAIEIESISGVTGIATEYYENDEIKLTDAKLYYVNNNGTTGSIDVTLDIISNFNTKMTGTQDEEREMTLSYSNKQFVLTYKVISYYATLSFDSVSNSVVEKELPTFNNKKILKSSAFEGVELNSNYFIINGYYTLIDGQRNTLNIGDFLVKDTKVYVELSFINTYNMFGVGSYDKPYLIYNEFQLKNLEEKVNEIDSQISFDGKIFNQMADIDLSIYSSWRPIGDYTIGKAFKGRFNGDGYKISNMTINTSENLACVGLFGYVTNTLENINLVNVNILNVGCSSKYAYNNNCYIGTIAGYISSSAICNSSVSGKIETDGHGEAFIVGSIVGDGYITNCLSNCSINITIAGQKAYINGLTNGKAINSVYKANINVLQIEIIDYTYIFGIARMGENCYSLGNIYYECTVDDLSNVEKIYCCALTVNFKNSFYYGSVFSKLLNDENEVFQQRINYILNNGATGENLYLCQEKIYQVRAGYTQAGFDASNYEKHNIKALTNEQILTGKTYFVGFESYVDAETLSTNSNCVWIFRAGNLPKLYWEKDI